MKKNTKEHIIEIGMDLISKKGYGNVGLKEILEKSGVPKGSFYYYFKSKEDFGVHVVEQYSIDSTQLIKSYLLDTSRSPLERLMTFFKDTRDVYTQKDFSEGCLLGNCSLELGDLNRNISNQVIIGMGQWQDLFEQCIREGQEDQSIANQTDAKVLADFIFNSWEGALLRMKVNKTITPINDFVIVINQLLT